MGNKLNEIQQALKVPKGQMNSFGKYKYRSLEDILEAVKPLLGEATLIIEDEIVQIGDRFYVKATAYLGDGEKEWQNTAFAREEFDKKGMDSAQITGAASSYARKYCLNGLFCIDDTKDPDAMDNSKEVPKSKTQETVETLEPTPVCSDCGKTMKQSKTGNFYCAGTYKGLCPVPPKDEATKSFQKELDNTTYPQPVTDGL